MNANWVEEEKTGPLSFVFYLIGWEGYKEKRVQ